jgi:6-phosphogluconolactonase
MAAVLLITAVMMISAQRTRRPNLKSGAVYVLTNQTVNSVMAFVRDPASGELQWTFTEPTGGAGDPMPPPPGMPTDPLASQGALALDEDNDYIYAVNAGSNEVSTLEVSPFGLEFVGKVPSGGEHPVSIALYGDLLYVLNSGGMANISGFHVAEDGTLTAIPG